MKFDFSNLGKSAFGFVPPQEKSMGKIVIYPKGLPVAKVVEALILSKQFTPNIELIEDTTGVVVDNLLVYDKPESNQKLKPHGLIGWEEMGRSQLG